MAIQREDQNGPACTSNGTDSLIAKFGQLNALDDLIRLRAADQVQLPILAYPNSEKDVASFAYYTGRDLDEMIGRVVGVLVESGFQPPKDDAATVALLTLSDINMVITFFALSRLGYTVMMLSPRLAGEACVSLLDQVNCDTILYGRSGSIQSTVAEILGQKTVNRHPIPDASMAAAAETILPDLHHNRMSRSQRNKIALVLHSSGSTGTPKPLFLTHEALMTHPLRGPGLTSFNPLPWYHLHGLSTALQAMWMRKTAYMWNAALPLTGKAVISVLEAIRPQLVAAVPYMLQLLVDSPGGIAALRACTLVTYGGAPCPDELGDHLVREGVPFGGSFGLTEAGLVAESISRPKDDPYWNYLRFFENIQQYIWMKPIGDSLYECVYLSGHPALTTSNSNEPRGSFHSKDVFTPHPTIPNRWKYASRLDDRITLVNREKVLPLPIEGFIQQDPLIGDAVLVGLGKAAAGVLIFQSQKAEDAKISDEEYLKAIWPTIQRANSRAERFSQISRDMIAILPHTAKFPRTDKGSMIRAQVYLQYAEVIENLYSKSEEIRGDLQLSLSGTQTLLLEICRSELLLSIPSIDSDFFAAGLDSLKAIQLRRLILQQLKVDKDALSRNIVYETGNVQALAEHICSLQTGRISTATDSEYSVMSSLIQKYSSFKEPIPPTAVSQKPKSVILTGATGFIGSHILYELLQDDTISTVYCLTRRTSPSESVLSSLSSRNLVLTRTQESKIHALTGAIDEPNFNLDSSTIDSMQETVTQIIHAAWPVHFNLSLSQFTPHIRGLHNLLQFSLSVHRSEPATMLFCSSISTALESPSLYIAEKPMALSDAYMGYGRSKLVGEHIVSAARRAGARCYSLRIGQVSGHSTMGLWNDTEALPLLIRSALVLKVLPQLDETCFWLPVDILAAAIVEIGRSRSSLSRTVSSIPNQGHGMGEGVTLADDSVYNLCNSHGFSWSLLLESLRRSGFEFEIAPFEIWISMLRESEARGEEHVNPAVTLVGHYETMYGNRSSLRTKRFCTERAERDSVTLRNEGLRIVENGILNCYARDWVKRWMTS